MTILQESYGNTAKTVIKNLTKRGMEGYYCATKEEAVAKAMELMEDNSVVSWGGSMTLSETGMMDALRASNHTLIDRMTAKTPDEQREIYAKTVMSDYYFMSTNAITYDGELVNIDGNGNRVACLITGPKNVIILAGMNKLTTDVDSAIARVHNQAAPPNGVRLNLDTPCAKTGVCSKCLSPQCMCCDTVVVRMSRNPGRIKVILIGESFGY